MENKADPHDSNTILAVEGLHLPVHITEGILEEASNVLEGSHFLGLVSGFLGLVDKLHWLTISLFGQSSVLRLDQATILTLKSCQLSR